MAKRIELKSWEKVNNARVKLTYKDDSILWVGIGDFDRAFGCILSASKEEVEKDFAIDPKTLLYIEPKLKSWDVVEGGKAKLEYTDGDVLYVPEDFFKDTFNCILVTPKSVIKRDHAIAI
jgi:hypothetical protein